MKKKRRSGTSLALLLLAACVLPAAAAKKKTVPESYGLVAGTVFQESGYALPNAEVTLIPAPPSDGASAPQKLKTLQAVTSARGEFSFRVPPVPMHYILKVVAKGWQPAEKSVAIQGEGRVDVTFQLQPESK